MPSSEQLSRLLEDPDVEGSVYSAPFDVWMRTIIERDIQAYKEAIPSGLSFELSLNPDQVSYLRAFGRNNLAGDWVRDFSEPAAQFSATKKQNVLHSLLGIVSIGAVVTKSGREFYRGYGISESNEEAIDNANIWPFIVSSGSGSEKPFGPFVKPLKTEDLDVLRIVRERDQELRERFKGRIIPSFHNTEVAKLVGVDPKDSNESLLRLCGLLGEKWISHPTYHTRRKWYVPAARRDDIDSFLAQNPQ